MAGRLVLPAEGDEMKQESPDMSSSRNCQKSLELDHEVYKRAELLWTILFLHQSEVR